MLAESQGQVVGKIPKVRVEVWAGWCVGLRQPRALRLARAVIPPPRLRAKWVFFSALLHLAEDGKDWALERAS